jgi:hypothetical protein
VWCYCVDLERAELIAKLLNEFHEPVASGRGAI